MILMALTMAQGPTTAAQTQGRARLTTALEALPVKARADRPQMVAAIDTAARAHRVDAVWLLAVSFVESRHNVAIVGDNGRSFGPFQMAMSAARAVNKKARKRALHRWPTAADMAARLWRKLFDKYGPKVAPVVYNCGPVRCKQKSGKQRRSTPATRGYWKYYRAMIRRIEE